jgi:multidrug resistance protein
MLVNTLGYGIIIPIIYPYSQKFGLTDFQNGMLFAIFALCTFISTPFIGRLSDKYGRRPLLLISLIGTAISFFMAAFAPNAAVLFLARALDGLTAGNIPVASAVISDTTKPEDRAKGFSIIGASFGFGFLFGPAIAAFTLPWGIEMPFIIAGVIALFASFIIFFFLKETNQHIGQVSNAKIIDFKKLYHMLFDPAVGKTLLISLISFTAFGCFIFAFQAFSRKVMNLDEITVSYIYIGFGLIGLISQLFIIPNVVKRYGELRALKFALLGSSIAAMLLFLNRSFPLYLAILALFSITNGFIMPMLQTILSKETDAKSQGSILGLNSSYMSLGNTVGPLLAGGLATFYLPLPFLLQSILVFSCFIIAAIALRNLPKKKESAF